MKKETENRALEMAQDYIKGLREDFEKLDNENLSEEEREELENALNDNYGVDIEKVYHITLAGGGPAMRITGELDENDLPISANLEYQDWFTPWIRLDISENQEDMLLRIAESQYFGE